MTHEARTATIEHIFLLAICMSYLIWRYLGLSRVCMCGFPLLIPPFFFGHLFLLAPSVAIRLLLLALSLATGVWKPPWEYGYGDYHAVAVLYILVIKSMWLVHLALFVFSDLW